jgi:hypothetical protein
MRIHTSAYTVIHPPLRSEPHRIACTVGQMVMEPYPFMWNWRLSKAEILAVIEQCSRDLAHKVNIGIQEQSSAALYREFESEDRDLAEAGLAEYRLLLDDADRT